MDKNDVMEKYRQEMMKLYGKSTNRNENDDIHLEQSNSDVAEVTDDKVNDDNKIGEVDETKENNISQSLEERYPEPVIDDVISEKNFDENEYNRRNQYDSIGWISVDVRTGESASPIEGASVIITSMADGNLIFKANGITNESGQIKKIALPAPSASLSLNSDNKIKPYSVYDVSVYADGFFRERSIDVPVFEGVTSVQLFEMIPIPLYMSENNETINYYNQEPELK